MSLAEPDVSFVVIAHNEQDHGPLTVRSILDQVTDATFELVFVDDGSTDDTPAVVLAAARGDSRLRLVRLANNLGRGAARSAGVEAATAPVVGFVDADILLPPDWLSRCLAELPGHAAVGGIAVPDGDAVALARVSGAKPRAVPGGMPITGNNVLFDRTAFDRTGFDPRDRIGEDFKLASRLLRSGLHLKRIPGLTVHHRDRRTYSQALRWRFENGLDASTHPRELRIIRLADAVWAGWLLASMVGIAGAVLVSPTWLLLPIAAAIAAAVTHVVTRFYLRPVMPFVVACIADIPLMAAYLVGRTIGIPRLLRGRR